MQVECIQELTRKVGQQSPADENRDVDCVQSTIPDNLPAWSQMLEELVLPFALIVVYHSHFNALAAFLGADRHDFKVLCWDEGAEV